MWNKIAFLVTYSLSFTCSSANEKNLNEYTLNFFKVSPKSEHQDIKLIINTHSFDPVKHKVEEDDSEFGFRVDGKIGYGFDGQESLKLNATEVIRKFGIFWKEKEIFLKPELFNTIFNYDLSEKNKNPKQIKSGIGVTISEDNTKLMISMTSYRCATASYTVYWIIEENGDQSRFVEVTSS